MIDESSLKTLDKIRSTLDHAAEVLRHSLELANGGVVFLDSTVRYCNGEKRVSPDTNNPSKVQAMSAAPHVEWSGNLDSRRLQSLIELYPKGGIWYFHENGCFESLDQVNRNRSTPATLKHQLEARDLSDIFPMAR